MQNLLIQSKFINAISYLSIIMNKGWFINMNCETFSSQPFQTTGLLKPFPWVPKLESIYKLKWTLMDPK